MSLVPKSRSPALTHCKHCTTVLLVYMHFCLSPPIPPPWMKALQRQELGLVHYHWGFQNSSGQREQSCSVNVDWIDWTTLLLPLEKSLTGPAELGASILMIKGTKVKAPRKIEWLSSFGSHIVRLSTMLSFRKPTNEKRQRLLNMSGSCRCDSCECNPTAPMTVGIWAPDCKRWRWKRSHSYGSCVWQGVSSLLIQRGCPGRPCFFSMSFHSQSGLNWEPKFYSNVLTAFLM